jgi:AcrR family transcriptional regulator
MTKQAVQRGVSKAEWLQAALETLAYGSVSGISIQSLAKKLGIARAGFYWHFKDRNDLLTQLLDYWVHEITEIITENLEIGALSPRERLIRAAEMVLQHNLARYEMGFQLWAVEDPAVAKKIKQVRSMKLRFVSLALEELQFCGEDVEMRAMLFVCYHNWESVMYADYTQKKRQAYIARRVDMIIKR